MQLVVINRPEPVLTLSGRFDAHEVPQFRTAIDPLYGTAHAIRLDLSDVLFIDSTALAELIRALHRARTHGQELIIVGLSAPVRVILELTKLNLALTIEVPGGVTLP